MQEYLYGVVPREMSKTWPLEALKAQAVVARTFAITNQNKFMHLGFNMDNSVLSQVYGGYDWEGPISNQAVDETIGMLLYYNTTLASAYYHSNSGGYTANSENVWSSEVPYLRSVFDPYSIGAKK
jgi:stage II sporulation protein D